MPIKAKLLAFLAYHYDREMTEITVGVWLITAGLLYGVFSLFMDSLYSLLERAGVFAAIFKFMGW